VIGAVAPIVPSQKPARLCASIVDRRDMAPAPPFSTAFNGSTGSTELSDQGFPADVVAAWLGHTVKVAVGRYNQITDDHFRRAVETEREEEPPARG